MNYRSRSLLFIQYLTKKEKSSIFNNTQTTGPQTCQEDPDPAGSVINFSPGSGSDNQDNGSADPYPDPKEIFRDPQH
jgi:hypothetical protein